MVKWESTDSAVGCVDDMDKCTAWGGSSPLEKLGPEEVNTFLISGRVG